MSYQKRVSTKQMLAKVYIFHQGLQQYIVQYQKMLTWYLDYMLAPIVKKANAADNKLFCCLPATRSVCPHSHTDASLVSAIGQEESVQNGGSSCHAYRNQPAHPRAFIGGGSCPLSFLSNLTNLLLVLLAKIANLVLFH